MKLNRTNKKITSLLLAILMVTSVFAAFITPAVAVGATPGTARNTFPATHETRDALIGQEIRITGVNITTPTVVFSGDLGAAEGHFFSVAAVAGVADIDTIARGMRAGRYNVSGFNATGVPFAFNLFMEPPILTLSVEIGDTVVTRVARGTNVTIDITDNIHDNDTGDIRLTDPAGLAQIKNPAGDAPVDNRTLRNLNFSRIDGFTMHTGGWDIGTWTIEVRTVEARAQGLDKRSNVVRLEIVEGDVDIRVADDTIEVGDKTAFTVTAPARRWVNITVDPPTNNSILIPNVSDIRAVPPHGHGIPDDRLNFTSNSTFDVLIRDGGTFVFAMRFVDDGEFTVRARLAGVGDDEIDITVAEPTITINPIPVTTIGEEIDIEGTATGLAAVYVRIEDPDGNPVLQPKNWTLLRVPVDHRDEWSDEWVTRGLDAGTYRIEVRDRADLGRAPEATIAVRLITGRLNVIVPDTVSETDSEDLEVEGTAIGADNVFVIVVENADSTVIRNESTNVDEDKFDIAMGRDLDEGRHTVFVIHPGGDGVPSIVPVLAQRGLRARLTISRIIEEVEDGLGRDDILVMKEFVVEEDKVTILPIPDVVVGETLTIEAETNRDDDTDVIVAITGPDGLVELETTEVEDGKVSVEFDTTNFVLGTWAVEVEVLDTPPEEATFRIVQVVVPPVPELTDIRVADARVEVGDTHRFTASPVPAGAEIGDITWSVEDEAIGTIDAATGVFTAIAAGETTITAEYGGVEGTATVTVTAPPVVVDPPVDPPVEPEPDVPGFGIIAAILGILGVAVLMLKKKN